MPVQSEVNHPLQEKKREWLALSALQIDRHWCMVMVTGTCFYRLLGMCRKWWPVSNLAELSITRALIMQHGGIALSFFSVVFVTSWSFPVLLSHMYRWTMWQTVRWCLRSRHLWKLFRWLKVSQLRWNCLKLFSAVFEGDAPLDLLRIDVGRGGYWRRRLFWKKMSENGQSEAHTLWSYIWSTKSHTRSHMYMNIVREMKIS